MRLNKFLSHSGVCSRRDADVYIQSGRVKVNGTVMTTPYIVQDDDKIMVDDRPLNLKTKTRVWIYYKPQGLVTTHKDPQNRPTVFNEPNIKKLGRVVSVGRLDLNSEGLLILTDSPEFSHYLEKPSNNYERCYRVRVFGDVDVAAMDDLKNGVTIDGINYKSLHVELDSTGDGRNHWLFVKLQEGKNREIRKVMHHLGLHVNRLIRVSYGPYEIDTMKPGDIIEVDDLRG